MGMDLKCSTGALHLGLGEWNDYLLLALSAGWQPVGTLAPESMMDDLDFPVGWDGDYFSNSGQGVTAVDARSLANALEQILPDIPDGQPLKLPRVLPIDDPDYYSLARIIERRVGYKHYLQEFIKFCCEGEFTIW